MPRSNELWAVTSYFNPMAFRQLRENYRTFRRHLLVPLVAVELAFGEREFELGPGDADILVQLRGGDILWQKERLLNIGLTFVPPECAKIAWLDCDVVFERPDWLEAASRLLEEFPLVQLFRIVRRLAPQQQPLPDAILEQQDRAVVWNLSQFESVEECFRNVQPRGICYGIAWAGQRDVLRQHGLYDAAVVGAGDRAFVYAAYGRADLMARRWCGNGRQMEHYLAWARPLAKRIGGRVANIDGALWHLWHGRVEDRQFTQRYEGFRRFDFDPAADIALDKSACWRWSSDKPEMHAYVRDYFAGRKEDG